MLNVAKIKKDFPIFSYHPGLVYLDSTASSLTPGCVIDKITQYYSEYRANIFRGIYKISEKATREYEKSRQLVADFIGAREKGEIIFTRSTTESINLVAYGLGRKIVRKRDEIVTTVMEHHSNFVPWQMLASETGAELRIIDILENGNLSIISSSRRKSQRIIIDDIITQKTKILAITYVSNVLGGINPIKKIVASAKKINPKIIIIVDAAQAVTHLKIDVSDLGCDFLAFSSHKMLGPTGVGILWGRFNLLEEMYPFNLGGDMVESVSLDSTNFKKPPHKFEAGTPNIAGVIGLQEAIKYIQNIGYSQIQNHEIKLKHMAVKRLLDTFGHEVTFYDMDKSDYGASIISFTLRGVHPHDLAQILDEENIAIRAGTHCAIPLHKRLGVGATARISPYIYNDMGDIDRFIKGLIKARGILRD